jgi:hypothetical protein
MTPDKTSLERWPVWWISEPDMETLTPRKTITPGEALSLFTSGELVVACDMAARLDEDGRFLVDEDELTDPGSSPRGNGLPVVEVDGFGGPFFHPLSVMAFLEEWLRCSPEELEEDRIELEKDEALRKEREAALRYEMDHPKPEILIEVVRVSCYLALETIQRNLDHQEEAVRIEAAKEARLLLEGLGKIA